MPSPGAQSDWKMTIAIVIVAIGFLIALAGGPSQFMLAIERTLEALVKDATDVYKGLRA